MDRDSTKQSIIQNSFQEDLIINWVKAFLMDRKAQNLSRGTLYFYRTKLQLFTNFCDSQGITLMSQITPSLIRELLLSLESTGHNPGGCHAVFRSVKTFLHWWEDEVEPENWKNPIEKVKAPKVGIDPLDPVDIEVIKDLLDVCKKPTLMCRRDRAIILFLLDTGVRANELVSLDIQDVNPTTGDVLIRSGKGRKPRTVFLGSKSRKALRAYIKLRKDNSPALWINNIGDRLTYWGLKTMMRRRARQANVKTPEIHAFRRAFALNCLRAGMDVYTLQNLMGHRDLQVLRRYLKQTTDDLASAHLRYAPVDKLIE
jgi:integrase/recombinase XerD